MIEQISRLIKSKKLSSSQFADEIGVQRSSISHVLSGRNKPSLDFVMKILQAYPDVDPDWLLSGTGSMFRDTVVHEGSGTLPFGDDYHKETEAENTGSIGDMPRQELKQHLKRKAGSAHNTSGQKVIDKIVLLYSDGTFGEFTPDQG